jgi:hypothetical protein
MHISVLWQERQVFWSPIPWVFSQFEPWVIFHALRLLAVFFGISDVWQVAQLESFVQSWQLMQVSMLGLFRTRAFMSCAIAPWHDVQRREDISLWLIRMPFFVLIIVFEIILLWQFVQYSFFTADVIGLPYVLENHFIALLPALSCIVRKEK